MKIRSTSAAKLTSCKHSASKLQTLPQLATPTHPKNITSNVPAPGPGEISARVEGSCTDANTAPATYSSVRASPLSEPLEPAEAEAITVLIATNEEKKKKAQYHSSN